MDLVESELLAAGFSLQGKDLDGCSVYMSVLDGEAIVVTVNYETGLFNIDRGGEAL